MYALPSNYLASDNDWPSKITVFPFPRAKDLILQRLPPQFHQHFKASFCANFLAPKKYRFNM
jgi:hypothetical protein